MTECHCSGPCACHAEPEPTLKAIFLTAIGDWSLVEPICVVLEDHGSEFIASWDEIEVFGSGTTEVEAISDLERSIADTWRNLTLSPDATLGPRTRRWKTLLSALVVVVPRDRWRPTADVRASGLPNCYCGCGRVHEDDAPDEPSESSIAARLALAENDLTDLSKLFVRLEAEVYRRDDRSCCRTNPEPAATSPAGAQAQRAPASGVLENVGPVAHPNATPIPNTDDTLTAFAFGTLRTALQHDPDYAGGWHYNIAMAFCDAGGGHTMANKAASLFMQRTFGVTTEFPGPGSRK